MWTGASLLASALRREPTGATLPITPYRDDKVGRQNRPLFVLKTSHLLWNPASTPLCIRMIGKLRTLLEPCRWRGGLPFLVLMQPQSI
jgi:hypothetical protein